MWKGSHGMTPVTATQNLNSKLRRANSNGRGRSSGFDSRNAPIRSYESPVRIFRGPGYQGGGYRINV
jgi:hypothetical protein